MGRLTPREREVLTLMAEGRSNAAIAGKMVVTAKAVDKHINSIFMKLDLTLDAEDNRRGARRAALPAGGLTGRPPAPGRGPARSQSPGQPRPPSGHRPLATEQDVGDAKADRGQQQPAGPPGDPAAAASSFAWD